MIIKVVVFYTLFNRPCYHNSVIKHVGVFTKDDMTTKACDDTTQITRHRYTEKSVMRRPNEEETRGKHSRLIRLTEYTPYVWLGLAIVAGIYTVYMSSSSETSVDENRWRMKSLSCLFSGTEWVAQWKGGEDNSDVRHTSTGAFPKTVSWYTNDKVSSCKQNWYGLGRENVGMDCAFLRGMTGDEKRKLFSYIWAGV